MDNEINFYPEGYILLSINKDLPGVVGKVGTVLGKSGINIAEYILSRSQQNKNPISIIKIDNNLSSECLKEINQIDEIIEIKQFKI